MRQAIEREIAALNITIHHQEVELQSLTQEIQKGIEEEGHAYILEHGEEDVKKIKEADKKLYGLKLQRNSLMWALKQEEE